jgi:hypothetical protein
MPSLHQHRRRLLQLCTWTLMSRSTSDMCLHRKKSSTATVAATTIPTSNLINAASTPICSHPRRFAIPTTASSRPGQPSPICLALRAERIRTTVARRPTRCRPRTPTRLLLRPLDLMTNRRCLRSA